MQANLRDGCRFHIHGQRIREIREHLRILLRTFEKALAGADQPEMHPATGLQAAGGRKQPGIRIEALRQTLHLPRQVPLTAPDIVMRRLRPYNHVENLHPRRQRPCTAGIDDTVRPLRKNHFRRQPCRGDFSDTGASYSLDSGTLQGLVLGGHRNN